MARTRQEAETRRPEVSSEEPFSGTPYVVGRGLTFPGASPKPVHTGCRAVWWQAGLWISGAVGFSVGSPYRLYLITGRTEGQTRVRACR